MSRAAVMLIWLTLVSNPLGAITEKITINVVEASSTVGPRSVAVFAKIILPDGSHARLICLEDCALITSFTPEKMPPDSETCETSGDQTTCRTIELGYYQATRKGIVLTIYGPKGKLRYEIVGSW